MSLTVPADLVDSLPEKLWSFGNVLRLCDRDLHFCTRETRTIELDGVEIGNGVRPFVDLVEGPGDWRISAEEMAAVGELIGMVQRSLGARAGPKATLRLLLTGGPVPFRVSRSSDFGVAD